MKMGDRKNYIARLRKTTRGEYRGNPTSDVSKILEIKYDMDKGFFVSPRRRKMLEDYEKGKVIDKLEE